MPIDHEKLNILYTIQPDNEPDFVKNILHIFLTSTEENIALLKSAFVTKNIDNMTRATHTMKSSSANIGAMELMNICKELETDCRLNQLHNSDKQIEIIINEFDRVQTYLRKNIL